MIKDSIKKDALDATVASIQAAGAAAVRAADRQFTGQVTIGDVTVAYPYVINGDGNPVLLDSVVRAADAEHGRLHPDRAGRYSMHDLASLLAWAQRYVGESSAAYVISPDADSCASGLVTVVVDDLPQKGADGGRRALRCTMPLELHDRLRDWLSSAETLMSVETFADFVRRATDELGSADLLTMVNNVEVHEESSWARVAGEDGSLKLKAESSQRTSRVPAAFAFRVPVFDGDPEQDAQTFTARLTVKVDKGKPVFAYEIVDVAPTLAQAVKRIRDAVAAVVPATYMGSAPA